MPWILRQGLPFAVERPDEKLEILQREEIRKGVEEMKAGKLVAHSDVVDRWLDRSRLA